MAQEIKITQTTNADMNIGVTKKNTAVEWLENELHNFINPEHGKDFLPIFEQAKQMEKQQIKMAYNDGADHMVESKYEGMDNYYKLRYGSNNQI